jgi:hypothetical protein
LLFWQIHSLIGIGESAHWKAWLVVLVFITPQIWASYTPRSFYTVYIAHRLNYNTHVLMTSLYYNWGFVDALAVAVNTHWDQLPKCTWAHEHRLCIHTDQIAERNQGTSLLLAIIILGPWNIIKNDRSYQEN